MSFSKLIGNPRQKAILQRLLRRGQIASTFIFAGPDGVGKRQFALTMAKAANCLSNAPAQGFADDCCDSCQSCRRIDEGSYGDVTTVVPDGQFIKIGQTRELAEEVFYRPREGRHRFFIVDAAERLREQAANSLLKTLEEPPPTSTIILVTSRPDALLTTIRSRSQRLSFTCLSTAEMEAYLKANFRRPAPEIELLARISQGRIGQATAYDLSVYRQQRRNLIEMLELMVEGNNRLRLLKAADFLAKKERDEFESELDILSDLLRDIFILSAGMPPASIINIDVAESLQNIAARVATDRLVVWAERIDQLRAGLRINLNRQLALESLLLDLTDAA